MTQLERRAFLALALVVPGAAVLSACAPTQPAPPSSSSGGTGEDLGELPAGVYSGARFETSPRPAEVTSFGPNGTHFPAGSDWIGGASDTELEVDCTWEAIGAAVTWLTGERVAEGATVRVRPGELSGDGSGSGSAPVLEAVGDPAWERNVVIVPRDGFGSVTVTGAGIRLNDVSRLSFFGFTGPEAGVVLTQCTSVEFGWGVFSSFAVTLGGADIALYELVLGFRRNANDTAAFRPTESFAMTNLQRYGCAFGPSVKPEGDDAHCDTLQIQRTGSGEFGPVLSVDCIDIGSSNAALMIDDVVSVVEFRHSLILAGGLPAVLFPVVAGDYVGDDPNAFAGAASDVRIADSVVVGAVGRTGFTQVENSSLSYKPQESQEPRESGQWTVDPSTGEWTKEHIEEVAGTALTVESLSGHWSW